MGTVQVRRTSANLNYTALRNEVSRKGACAAPLTPLQVGNAASLKLILRRLITRGALSIVNRVTLH
jgi:hypothetical protein